MTRCGTLPLLAACCLPLGASARQRLAAGPNVQVSGQLAEVVQVEPFIAVDPADPVRMVVAAIALRRPHASDWQDQQTVLVYRSEDHGRTWSLQPVAALPAGWAAGGEGVIQGIGPVLVA